MNYWSVLSKVHEQISWRKRSKCKRKWPIYWLSPSFNWAGVSTLPLSALAVRTWAWKPWQRLWQQLLPIFRVNFFIDNVRGRDPSWKDPKGCIEKRTAASTRLPVPSRESSSPVGVFCPSRSCSRPPPPRRTKTWSTRHRWELTTRRKASIGSWIPPNTMRRWWAFSQGCRLSPWRSACYRKRIKSK